MLISLNVYALIILCYFIFRNRIDFLLLFFCSLVLYHWQIFSGTIWVPPYTFLASQEAMLIVIIVLTVIFGFTLIHDQVSVNDLLTRYKPDRNGTQGYIAIILLFISYVFLLYSYYRAGDKLFLGKHEYSLAEGIKYNFFLYYPAAMVLPYSVAKKRYWLFLFSLLPLIYYFFIGYRAVFVVAIVGAVVVHNYGQRILTFRMLKILIFILFLYVFFVFFKFSYIDLKAGTFDWFETMIDQDERFDSLLDLLLWGMFSAEFGQVSSNLSLSSSLDLSQYYSFSNAFLGSISGLNSILDLNEDLKRFSHTIRIYANPGFSYGLGSTIWGEAYQAGGFFGVFVMASCIVSCIAHFNFKFARSNDSSLFLIYISFLSFYCHRNDFVLLVGWLKNVIFLLILAYVIFFIFRIVITGKFKASFFRQKYL